MPKYNKLLEKYNKNIRFYKSLHTACQFAFYSYKNHMVESIHFYCSQVYYARHYRKRQHLKIHFYAKQK